MLSLLMAIFQLPCVMRNPPNTFRFCLPVTNAPALYCPIGPEKLSPKMARYPHWPNSVTTYMDRTMAPCGLVSLTMVKLAVGPSQAVSGWLHGSCPEPEDA